MTGSSISPEASVRHDDVPEQRAHERSAATRARQLLTDVRAANERLLEAVDRLDERAMREPCRLPGWTRAHLITHLARNADGLLNLLTWARTGVEHPMYASNADRDADIEEGSIRPGQVLQEDLRAAGDRLAAAAERLTDSQWLATVVAREQAPIPAANIPSLRLFELWVHLVDLDVGVAFADFPAEHLEGMVDRAVARFAGRADVPSVRLRVDLPGDAERVWDLAGGVPDDGPPELSGGAAAVLAWLTGRGDGAELTGDVPRLPAWA